MQPHAPSTIYAILRSNMLRLIVIVGDAIGRETTDEKRIVQPNPRRKTSANEELWIQFKSITHPFPDYMAHCAN